MKNRKIEDRKLSIKLNKAVNMFKLKIKIVLF